jgi:arylsulfatase A-like enzyme
MEQLGVESRSAYTRRDFLRTAGIGAAAVASSGWLHAADGVAEQPNIVLIMADDMGFSDIGCYGGEIHTPNLDRLAANGLRFGQFYNTARCCPTRASLLTGLYPHQAGVGHMMSDQGFDAYRGDLNRSCVTIAEALKPAGYATYMSGKWHVTRHTAPDGPKDNWPCQRGFDRYYGTLVGAGSFWKPSALTRDNTRLRSYPEGFYYTDAISDNAAQFIRQHRGSRARSPFFLYVAYTSPHWPLHAPREDVDRYRGRYMKGWDALRAERYARMVEMGLVDPKWPIAPRDEAATAWDEVPPEQQENMDWRMAVYAAQIDRMDRGIGRIVATLEETGQLNNTLIFFLSDNGGCAEGGPWGFERKDGGTLGEDSSYASYGLSWANASNTPFRRYKHWVHEGGISSPLVVHWPAQIEARGAIRRQPGHVIDIMATCLDAAGATYPSSYAGQAIEPLEGKSLVPAFEDGPIEREAIYWEHEGNRAVRRGKWKLVSKHPGAWELYDLEADRTELTDLADEQPELVAELSALYEVWAQRCGVRPWPVREDVGSEKTEFVLKQGDVLPREEAPRVAGKPVSIAATITAEGPDGVIVAQGGSRVGYSLYLKDGKLTMAVRRAGGDQPAIVAAPERLPAGQVTVAAHLARDGKITLEVAGEQVAAGKAPGPCNEMPVDGLEVGSDQKGAVGDYEVPNEFVGTIGEVRLKLGE